MTTYKIPYLTSAISGIGGSIKQRPEDFVVHELPLYDVSGEGEHVFVEIEKTGISTFDAIDLIAQKLQIDSRQIGYAGMKDAAAVTRQVLSIPMADPEIVMNLQ